MSRSPELLLSSVPIRVSVKELPGASDGSAMTSVTAALKMPVWVQPPKSALVLAVCIASRSEQFEPTLPKSSVAVFTVMLAASASSGANSAAATTIPLQ